MLKESKKMHLANARPNLSSNYYNNKKLQTPVLQLFCVDVDMVKLKHKLI